MSFKKDENARSDYDMGLSLLKNDPKEQRQDIHPPSLLPVFEIREILVKDKISETHFRGSEVSVFGIRRRCRDRDCGWLQPSAFFTKVLPLSWGGWCQMVLENVCPDEADSSLVRSIVNAGSTMFKGAYSSLPRERNRQTKQSCIARFVLFLNTIITVEDGYLEDYNALSRDNVL